MGEVVFLREEHTNWLSSARWAALKTYMHVLCRLSRLYLGIYIIINEKRGAYLEESKEVYMGVAGRERRNDTIIISKGIFKNFKIKMRIEI